jgi:hypothetical protein
MPRDPRFIERRALSNADMRAANRIAAFLIRLTPHDRAIIMRGVGSHHGAGTVRWTLGALFALLDAGATREEEAGEGPGVGGGGGRSTPGNGSHAGGGRKRT